MFSLTLIIIPILIGIGIFAGVMTTFLDCKEGDRE